MSTLVFVENTGDELSQQALAFARAVDPEVIAVTVDSDTPYAPAAWAQALVEAINQRSPQTVIAAGTDRGNEVLAHVAAKLDLPMSRWSENPATRTVAIRIAPNRKNLSGWSADVARR